MFVAMLVTSCDTSQDIFGSGNEAPRLLIKRPNDSVFGRKQTDTTKLNNGKYLLSYRIDDDESLDVSVSADPLFTAKTANGVVTVVPKGTGVGTLKLTVEDSWGSKDEITLQLTCIDNLLPKALLEVSDVQNFNSEKLIDASKSIDMDGAYGGRITLYRFLVNGKEIDKTYHPYIYYTFPSSGQFEVGLQVMDNNSQWSTVVYRKINI